MDACDSGRWRELRRNGSGVAKGESAEKLAVWEVDGDVVAEEGVDIVAVTVMPVGCSSLASLS